MRKALALALSVVPAVASAQEPDLGGCPVLPFDSIWNVPVDTLPVDSRSADYVASIGSTVGVHPDFGSGLWQGAPIGIPFVVVAGSQAEVEIRYQAYGDESDPGPFPVPRDAPIEGGPSSNGDRHVLVVDRDACVLYELYRAFPNADGSWNADSGASYDLASHALRTAGWTSADAAGLPILPGLARHDEVAAGEIRHALRFTAPQTRRAYVWPARHFASSSTNAALPPMGQRFRLKAGFDISGFSPQVQVILRALKKYGMILADNGSPWYISGAPDPGWDDDALVGELRNVKGSDFEAVDVSSLRIHEDSGRARVLDLGDAPDAPYRTLLASGGASHLAGSLRLGASVDTEVDGQPHAGAQGDDLSGDDEDGVQFTTGIVAGGVATVRVTASAAARVDAWVDWNRDGDWQDLDEQILNARPVAAGSQSIDFAVPGSASPGTTFARFRLSSAGGLDPDGHAPDGEVEDHALTVTAGSGDTTPPTVAVSAPNGGEKLYTGSGFRIDWTASDNVALARFDVAYSTNSGASWSAVPGCSGVSGAARSCLWAAPGPASNSVRVRVTALDSSGNSAADASDANASIVSGAASLTVTAPNSNVSWAAGGLQRIQWRHNLGPAARVRIELDRQDDGVFEELIAASAPSTTGTAGSHDWTVTAPNSATARVRVSWTANPGVSDVGNTTFRIAAPFLTVSVPNTIQDWLVGSAQPIRWNHNLGIGTVAKVELNRNYPTGAWQTLKAAVTHSAGTSGSWSWTVTGPATLLARIRVSTTDGTLVDVGNKSFSISSTPSLTLTQPNTALSLAAGTKYVCKWSHNLGTAPQLKLELNRSYPGGPWETIKAPYISTSGTAGSFGWTVTGPGTTRARVRISTLDGARSDTSDQDFAIVP